MKSSKILLLMLLAVAVHGQSASTIHGIKVTSPSTFDAQTRTVKLTFMNDSPANITAWGYCVSGQNAPGQTVSHNFCTLVDPLVTVIWYKIESTKRPFLPEPDCPMCRLVHPGQEMTLSASFPPDTVDARIDVTLIAFEGGSVEATPQAADASEVSELNQLTANRKAGLKYRMIWIDMGNRILADPNDQHPAATMIGKLASDPAMADMLRQFKRPEHNQGNDREFIPENERDYLQQFVAEQRIWAAELAKNQVIGGKQ
jgi:hypothetical protein